MRTAEPLKLILPAYSMALKLPVGTVLHSTFKKTLHGADGSRGRTTFSQLGGSFA